MQNKSLKIFLTIIAILVSVNLIGCGLKNENYIENTNGKTSKIETDIENESLEENESNSSAILTPAIRTKRNTKWKYNNDGDIYIDWDIEDIYDNVGNLVKTNSYNFEGKLYHWTENAYDSTNNKIKSISFNEDGSIDEKIEYEYDECLYLSKIIYYSPNGSITSEVTYQNQYDGKGNIIKSVSFDADRNITSVIENQYNEKNELIYYCYSRDDYVSQESYMYDDEGNITKEIFYDKEGKIIESYEYIYIMDGEYNKQIKIRCNPEGNKRIALSNSYDLEGKLIYSLRYSDAEYLSINDFDEKKATSKEEFEYDQYGNEVKYIQTRNPESQDKEITMIVETKYEYYE